MGRPLEYCGLSDEEADEVAAALVRAAKRAAEDTRKTGTKLAVWQDGKVVLLTPDEFEEKVSVVQEDSKAGYVKEEV
ncbi:MAG: hypothetical protein HZC36_12925 [Armatimonadetes bacterium]|nr:hypothetical protein [Armatimonadota bacterium]